MSKLLSPHFTDDELRCKGCTGDCTFSQEGKPIVNVQRAALNKLEVMREILGVPLIIYSASRCPIHNVKVGGAPMSQHRADIMMQSTAFDIALVVEKDRMIAAAEQAGFRGIGVNYQSFLHVDNRLSKVRW